VKLLANPLKRFALTEIAPKAGLKARAKCFVAVRKRRLEHERGVVGAEDPVTRGPNLGMAPTKVATADRGKDIASDQGDQPLEAVPGIGIDSNEEAHSADRRFDPLTAAASDRRRES
jgi:hypothetical protein